MFAFLGDGQGGVRATRVRRRNAVYGFDLGDVNEDGIVDLVVADGQVYSWGTTGARGSPWPEGIGDGTFETLQQYDTADPGGAYRVLYNVLIGDLNGDGNPDIFTSHADLLAGPAWALRAAAALRWRIVPADHMLADVNGDGLLDALGYTVYR